MVESLTQREIEILEYFQQGLSNREIGSRLYLTVGTVKWYAQQIFNKLGVSSRGAAVEVARARGLLGQPEVTAPPAVTPHRLPAEISAFVGREQEITLICARFAQARLITLVGMGGIGKTRLALRVAAALRDDFSDGVFFVDLTTAHHADGVLHEIAHALEVRDSPQRSLLAGLQGTLARMTCLLVLDNFEHVIDAAPLVTQLLAAASDLKILVTSREVLNLTGEQLIPVPTLGVPHEADPMELIEMADSVALFVERAQAIRPDFTLNPDNAQAIAAICRRLDGLPLALELAAAWVRLFAPAALLDNLTQPHEMLTSRARDGLERHHTLKHAIAWSYNLLAEAERRLFLRLAVFPGGATVEAIDAVCGDFSPLELINTLNALVDKSLVQQVDGADGEPRFRLLTMIREYAFDQFTDPAELDTLKAHHAGFFCAMAQTAARSPRQYRIWLRRLEQESENLNFALGWLLDAGDCVRLIAMANALFRYWLRYNPVEGMTWGEQIFAHCGAAALDDADLNYHMARIAYNADAVPMRQACIDRLARIAQASGDHLHLARAITLRTIYQPGDDVEVDFGRLESVLGEALHHYRLAEDLSGIGWIESVLGLTTMMQGDYETAARQLEEGYRFFIEIGDSWLAAGALQNLALCNLFRGNPALARAQFIDAARGQREEGTYDGIANSIVGLAGVACAGEDYDEAMRMLALVELILRRFSVILDYPERSLHADYVAACEAHCTPEQREAIRRRTLGQPLEALLDAL